ncbi:MAG: ABC transporter ATP-binding protein [Halobacteriaceae archaeon]
MTTIELEDVTKVFGDDVVAVDDVSLTIEDGELVVLVGPSGSGKSTTLRMIAGLEDVTEGEVRIDGAIVNDVQPQDRDIAMVFQSFALYPHRSVEGNLAFPLEARGVDKADREERVRDAAELLGISELLDRRPSQLSGGQQQRVALGRAIVRDPQAFLMDEPLANLDAKLRKEMRREVVLLQQRLDVTMVHVTHNQEEAMTMGDRIAVMNEGEIQQMAPPAETYARPANRFVAEFIGSPSMNTISGTAEGETFQARQADMSVSLPGDLAEVTGEATLGIRPEHVEIHEDPTEAETAFVASVDVVENLGDSQVVYFEFESFEFLAIIDPGRSVAVGEEVGVALPPDHLHLFDGLGPNAERISRSVSRDVEGPPR